MRTLLVKQEIYDAIDLCEKSFEVDKKNEFAFILLDLIYKLL